MALAIVTEHQTTGKALLFAWLVETIAVAMGLILAIFAGIEGSDGGPIAITVAILPFIALSIIELTKIPLVGLAFRVDSLFWRLLATAALLIVTAATFENFVFGFERGFNERIRAVQTAEQTLLDRQRALQIANTDLPVLTARQADLTARLAALRDEVAAIRQQSRDDVADARTSTLTPELAAERARIDQDLRDLDSREPAEIQRELARCRVTETSCRTTAIHAAYRQQRDALTRRSTDLLDQQRRSETQTTSETTAARTRRDADLAARDKDRQALETDLDATRTQLAAAQTTALQGSQAVAQAERDRDARIDRSQLHRLAAILYGNNDPATVERTKKIFVVSLAAIVALIGSLIAAMHYAAQAADARASMRAQALAPRRRPLTTALRHYLARRRRRIPILRDVAEELRQRHGLIRNLRGWLARRRRARRPVVTRTVTQEVPIERLKLIFLPLNATEEQIETVRREHGATEAA